MRRRQMYAQHIEAVVLEALHAEIEPPKLVKDACKVCGKVVPRGMAGHMRSHK